MSHGFGISRILALGALFALAVSACNGISDGTRFSDTRIPVRTVRPGPIVIRTPRPIPIIIRTPIPIPERPRPLPPINLNVPAFDYGGKRPYSFGGDGICGARLTTPSENLPHTTVLGAAIRGAKDFATLGIGACLDVVSEILLRTENDLPVDEFFVKPFLPNGYGKASIPARVFLWQEGEVLPSRIPSRWRSMPVTTIGGRILEGRALLVASDFTVNRLDTGIPNEWIDIKPALQRGHVNGKTTTYVILEDGSGTTQMERMQVLLTLKPFNQLSVGEFDGADLAYFGKRYTPYQTVLPETGERLVVTRRGSIQSETDPEVWIPYGKIPVAGGGLVEFRTLGETKRLEAVDNSDPNAPRLPGFYFVPQTLVLTKNTDRDLNLEIEAYRLPREGTPVKVKVGSFVLTGSTNSLDISNAEPPEFDASNEGMLCYALNLVLKLDGKAVATSTTWQGFCGGEPVAKGFSFPF